MVYDKKCGVIAMLCDLVEAGKVILYAYECVLCVYGYGCVCARTYCVCVLWVLWVLWVCVCVCVYCVCVLQEVCYQYWPSGESQMFGEFTVQLLGQEDQTGFVLRNFTVTNSKVWLHTS